MKKLKSDVTDWGANVIITSRSSAEIFSLHRSEEFHNGIGVYVCALEKRPREGVVRGCQSWIELGEDILMKEVLKYEEDEIG